MFCRQCGTNIADDATFCPSCGAQQTAAPAPAPAPIIKVETPESQKSTLFKFATIGNIIAFGALCFVFVYGWLYFDVFAFVSVAISLFFGASIAGFVFSLVSMGQIGKRGAATKAMEILVRIFFYINIGAVIAMLIMR